MLHNPGYSALPRPRAPRCVAILALFSSFSSRPPSLSFSPFPHFSVRLLSFCPPLCPASHTFHTFFSFFFPLLFFLILFCLVRHCCPFSLSPSLALFMNHSFLSPFSLSYRSGWRLISSCSLFLFSSSLPLTFARVSVFPCDISLTVPKTAEVL